ncbi:GATA zinc finger domain-containing protein [Trichoderma breve]|uniref:GATA zinc finger domain-containing protein n=1 Tax=Trichoderma breve TaxID=2034170 RepID=A0A9W9BG59_9HYPO|nr:GATA zinc finger domain-containing protein [Trichoderma breve]KAJ4862752.1 GATA zinc finger domain-containing protein [Trichoderma breve]
MAGPPPLQGDFFGFGNLDVLPMFPPAGPSQGILDSDSHAHAHAHAHALRFDDDDNDDDAMALLEGNMMAQFGSDMGLGLDPMAAMMDGDGSDIISPDAILTAQDQFNTVANDVPGAGPLPAAAFAPPAMSSSNPLTEFTKRRNWPAKVVEELRDLLQILDSNGRIRYVSPSITALAGYTTEEVQDTFLKHLIHPDDQGVLVAELHESIATGNPLRMFYRMKKKDGTYAIFEAVGHAHIAAARFAPNPNNQSPFCQAVFMMARLYPTKNAALLDSFLEHKIENERLRRRIAELRREEEAEAEEAQRQWAQSREGRSDITPSEDAGRSSSTAYAASNLPTDMSMSSGNTDGALTRKNLEDVTADTIALLTGIENGERMSNGNRSPTLIKGDAGIAMPMDRDSRSGDKKKKLKLAEEYVCTDCGTLDSPEWRKGPNGPKTLCNACGLRWAKKEKKRNSVGTPLAKPAQA